MKTHTLTTYEVTELKERSPNGYANALRRHQHSQREIFWQDEIIDSLKALLKKAGVKLTDWSLGAYHRNNYVRIEFPVSEVEELSGHRALAWLENNLLHSLRIPWKGARRREVAKYGAFYRPGCVPPCPFTGYCADDDYLESLRRDLRAGMTLKDAFTALADVCQHLLEEELDHQCSEEFFFEDAHHNAVEFLEDGRIYA